MRAGFVLSCPELTARRAFTILICLLSFSSLSAEPKPSVVAISFENDVMAVLSKGGCNAGPCHGNKNGKGGFKLSLRGQDPEADYFALTRELLGRRVNAVHPEESLILLKPTTQLSHEGGLRFATNSAEFELVQRWLAAGMERRPVGQPVLKELQVEPEERVILQPQTNAQLKAVAIFSDGTRRDVTSLAVYECSDTALKVSHDGLVQAGKNGESTILVRYLQEQRPVRLAFVPSRPGFKPRTPPLGNYIDREIFSKLAALRMNPSEVCSDAVFARRVYLDLLGFLPSAGEARAFVVSKARNKRQKLVEELLERPEFPEFWALKWSDLLRNEEKALDRKGVQNFYHWIEASLAENKPLDRFVQELLSSVGSSYQRPAANYYRANREPIARAEATAQLFLGTRLQCAQCHNHPFDRWTQDDYYNWADVFSRVSYKILENRRRDNNDSHEFVGEQVVFQAREGEMKDPRGKKVRPQFLGDREASTAPEGDRLEALGRWVTSHPLFAKAQVNRVWYHLMGRGIVDPIDDFRATNPASHPRLLESMAQDFARHHFDLRYLIRLIMSSTTYQLSSEPNETNAEDEINFSHNLVRRLTAEQMLDAQHEVTGVPTRFNGYPVGMRAGQIPGVEAVRNRDVKASDGDQFLELFGKPPRLLTCECERSMDTSMTQAFQLISGPAMDALLVSPENRLTRLSALAPREAVDELYWWALGRPPSSQEMEKAVAHAGRAKSVRKALEDLTWALLNAKEFVLRH